MTTTARSRRRLAVLVTTTALLLGGCTGGDEPSPSSQTSSSSPDLVEPEDAPTLEVEPVTRSGTIVGRLPRRDRARVEKAIAAIAARFLDAAYLAGDYPRGDFRDAFPGFTAGAAKVARTDRALLTNQPIGKRIDDVTPTRIGVKVDLLAVNQRAVAATAHVDLAFRTDGRAARRVRVIGELRLTKQDGRWKIFAYDLSKGAR